MAGRSRLTEAAPLRIGIVSPYSFAVPGGVQGHIRDLADTLRRAGHRVGVLAPAEPDDGLPPHVTSGGRSIPVRYNGSVARLTFGPVAAARTRRWLRGGDFDVLHVHEPLAPSLSLLACLLARGPVVATFHTAIPRSRALAAGRGIAQLVLEKITARIAVSPMARRVQVEHLGGGATEIPNGVMVNQFADADPLGGWPGPGGAIGFVGRFGETRKGFAVLRDAFARLAAEHPGLRLLVLGPGDTRHAVEGLSGPLRERVTFLGMADDAIKARMLRGVDVYVAPNLGGESFGMILTEAMAAGTPVVASDLDAFRRVLDDGRAGELVEPGDPAALATAIDALLADPLRCKQYAAHASSLVAANDWAEVAERVREVYVAAIEACGRPVAAPLAA